jgi:hypothetical protein
MLNSTECVSVGVKWNSWLDRKWNLHHQRTGELERPDELAAGRRHHPQAGGPRYAEWAALTSCSFIATCYD